MDADRLRQMADAAEEKWGGGWYCWESETDDDFRMESREDAQLVSVLGPDAARLLADAMDALQGVVLDPEAIEHPRAPSTVTRGMREHMAAVLARFAALGEDTT
jgi:hypothetical protein